MLDFIMSLIQSAVFVSVGSAIEQLVADILASLTGGLL